MSEHTPEPWGYFVQGGESASVPPTTGFLIGPRMQSYNKAQGFNPEDARRIVACVNACAGIPIGALEKAAECAGAGKFGTMAAMYKDQRDKILALMKEIDDESEYWGEYDANGLMNRIHDSITEIGGEK